MSRQTIGMLGLVLWWVAATGCGPSPGGGIALEVRFAQMEQAQTAAGGLPLGVQSYLVEAWTGGLDGTLVESTDCIDIDANDAKRMSLQVDLPAQMVVFLMVKAYGGSKCIGNHDWFGMSGSVVIQAGKKIRVPIYVTRRGMRLNPTRAQFVKPRAFATATSLDDGRILLAGGFENPISINGRTQLQASCDAVLYDPGTARFSSHVPLATGCRGLHRALKLSDGRVMLVGGTGQVLADFSGGVTVRPSGDYLATGAEVFDPESNQFTAVSTEVPDIGRADTAAAVLSNDRVVLMGGRTVGLESDGIILGEPTSGQWIWTPAGSLVTPRSGARAFRHTEGILVVGGNDSEAEPVELVDPASFNSTAVALSANADLAITGHSLSSLDDVVMIVGGVPTESGARPTDDVVGVLFESGVPSFFEDSLVHPRAFHAATEMKCGSTSCILVAGGLDDSLSARKDLEVFPPGLENPVLQDALETGSIGIAAALLPDGSVLLAGGLDLDAGGVKLSEVVQLLSP